VVDRLESNRAGEASHAFAVSDGSSPLGAPSTAPDPNEVPRLQEVGVGLELPRQDAFVERVQGAIGAALAAGGVTASDVAGRLAVSEATLRRRLREVGLSYQTLLDEIRYQLAERYLRQTDMDVAEVAFSLGFADPSSFGRAFKRWSGLTPLEFRRGGP